MGTPSSRNSTFLVKRLELCPGKALDSLLSMRQ